MTTVENPLNFDLRDCSYFDLLRSYMRLHVYPHSVLLSSKFLLCAPVLFYLSSSTSRRCCCGHRGRRLVGLSRTESLTITSIHYSTSRQTGLDLGENKCSCFGRKKFVFHKTSNFSCFKAICRLTMHYIISSQDSCSFLLSDFCRLSEQCELNGM